MFQNTNVNVIIASVAVIIAAGVLGSVRQHPTHRSINVTGECMRELSKDRTAITLRIQNVEKDAAAANARTSQTYDRIAAFITENFKNAELETTEISSRERREWNQANKRNELIGFESTIRLDIVVRDRSEISKILANALANTNVMSEGLRSFVSPRALREGQDACIAEAMADARTKAGKLAASGGARVGRMTHASYHTNQNNHMPQPRRMMRSAGAVMDNAMAAPEIFARDETISITVNAGFDLR